MIGLLVNANCILNDHKNIKKNVRSKETNLMDRNIGKHHRSHLKMKSVGKIEEQVDEKQLEDDYLDNVTDFDDRNFDSVTIETKKLAEKFAKDVLKSPKTQETINKLANVESSRKTTTDAYLEFTVEENGDKDEPIKKSKRLKSSKRKGQKKKKRKKHRHRRNEKLIHREPRRSKNISYKADYKNKRNKNLAKIKSIEKEKKSNINSKDKQLKRHLYDRIDKDINYIIDNVTIVTDLNDYVDLTESTITNTETTTISVKTEVTTVRDDEKQSMIERLMKTTTKDPTKTNSGDQGAEYSDYYNDVNDEIFKKIESNPRARSVRQSFTISSSNNDDPIYFQSEEQLSSSNRVLPKIISNHNLNDELYSSNENVQDYQTDKYPKFDQNNLDENSLFVQSNDDRYNLPLYTNVDKNIYNNYEYNLGQERQNYLNNYDSLLEKNNEKYIYPLIDKDRDNLMYNQFQLRSDPISTPLINNYEENMIESKNPINVYSEPYEKTFVLPSEQQQQLHYIPLYKNKNLDNRLYPNQNQKINNQPVALTNLNNNLYQPLKKVVNIPSPKEHVQPVEKFLNTGNLNSEEKWIKQDEVNDAATLNQQMNKPGLQKGEKNVIDGSRIYDQSSPGVVKENNNKFLEPKRNGIRNRNSVEEDVANMQNVNIVATVNETKEVADQILNRIVDELEEMKMGNSKDKTNDGLPCELTGSWVTNKAGVRLDMKVLNQSIIVTLANLIPQPIHVGLLNTTWNVTGHAPFKRGGPFSLFAYDNRTKTLAIFVGSCKVCQGIDTIQGVWSVAREPRDCRNFQMAIGIFNDIFRRTKLLTAIQKKKKIIMQSLIGNNTNTTIENVTSKTENNS